MATIVLTVVGSAVGGPIGGLIGSAIGQQIDSAIFRPGGRREGPRIKELAVQTSSYGTQIPGVFGAMRVAGSVIWSTDLIEKRSTSSGKGRPTTVNYSYSVSMAVALSSRPVARVGRIWADGNLMRGAQGDFKVETGFRLHPGHADQLPDPLIASAEGIGNCPAYRGISYAVFENLQLSDYGNRIPSLTFELFERDGSVLVSEICSAASDGLIAGTVPDELAGYALQGDSARAAIAPLLDAGIARVRPVADGLQLFRPETLGAFAGSLDAVVGADRAENGTLNQSRLAARREPVAVSLRYYDPERDYQAGMQRSGWSVSGQLDEQLDFPAVLNTGQAQRLAKEIAVAGRLRRDRRRLSIGTGAIAPQIGQSVVDPSMRIVEIEHFGGYAVLSCERMSTALDTASVTEPGRHQPSPDLSAGQTLLEVVELPSLGPSPANEPVMAIVAGGTGAGWRRAAVSRDINGSLVLLGSVEPASAIGVSLAPLGAHSPNLIDNFNTLLVRIDTNAIPPQPGASSPLAPDSPALIVGDELIRYGMIEPVGENSYKLRNLLRDIAHTGSIDHPAGARVAFLERDNLLLPDWGAISSGAELVVEALGLADQQPASRSITVSGVATRPLAPAHLRANRKADGGILLDWIRRARHDYGWLDNVDIPLVESASRYRVSATCNGSELLVAEYIGETALVGPGSIATWALPAGSVVQFSVRQIGDYGLSEPAQLSFVI